jgi:hypothetical protein
MRSINILPILVNIEGRSRKVSSREEGKVITAAAPRVVGG